jgi:hypothetical protein
MATDLSTCWAKTSHPAPSIRSALQPRTPMQEVGLVVISVKLRITVATTDHSSHPRAGSNGAPREIQLVRQEA